MKLNPSLQAAIQQEAANYFTSESEKHEATNPEKGLNILRVTTDFISGAEAMARLLLSASADDLGMESLAFDYAVSAIDEYDAEQHADAVASIMTDFLAGAAAAATITDSFDFHTDILFPYLQDTLNQVSTETLIRGLDEIWEVSKAMRKVADSKVHTVGKVRLLHAAVAIEIASVFQARGIQLTEVPAAVKILSEIPGSNN